MWGEGFAKMGVGGDIRLDCSWVGNEGLCEVVEARDFELETWWLN